MIARSAATLRADQISALVRLARLPEMIRGYGHVKEKSIQRFQVERTRAEADLQNTAFAQAAE